jgi:hypothetical protein
VPDLIVRITRGYAATSEAKVLDVRAGRPPFVAARPPFPAIRIGSLYLR